MKKILTFVSLVLSLAAVADSTSPINPAFLKWQRDRNAAPAITNQPTQVARQAKLALASVTPPQTMDAEVGGTGLMPSPLDLSYLKNLNSGAVKAPTGAGFPVKYDLRSERLLTTVKNQGPYGTCWAHATCASLESWILKSEGTACDFSEKNMASLHGFDWGFNDGGNMHVAAAYLLRWLGPVDETTDPYCSTVASRKSNPVRHVQAVKILPGRTSAMDNARIKRAVMDFGALYVNYCHEPNFYDSRNHSYYCPDRYTSNHAVTIVGWDDTYSRSNFAYVPNGVSPPGNGAWIVRNSWGSSWGEGGYFYVSYYDMTFGWGEIAAFASAEPTDNYAGVYQYDDYGWVTSYGGSSTEAYGANIFKATSSASLAAVGFYAAVPNMEYTVTIRTGVTAGNPASGTERLVQSGRADYAGYLTVPLESIVAITKSQSFAVIVRFKTPGYSYPVPVECYYPGYTSAATSSAGESFFSWDGVNWNDLYANNKSMNVCIKAYTKGTAAVTLQSVEIDGETSLASGASADYTCNAVYSDGSSRTVKPAWSLAAGSSYATLSSNGRLTARTVESAADVTLKAVYTEGAVTRETTMGVKILCGRPDIVTGLTASDDETDAVRLVWDAAANAETYSVYRANQNDTRKACYLGDTRGETTFADTTATPGITYYYFIKALNASGSSRDFSASATGVRRLSSPAEVRATDGSSYDAVTVTWSDATGARSYRVWRKTASGIDAPVPVSAYLGASVRSFDDTSAVPDVRYTYFVTAALDATGRLESDLTTSDNGYRRIRIVLARVEVNGPSTVNPSTTVQFTANAVYSDDSVTTGVAATWQVETTVPGVSIDASGLLSLPAFAETRPLTVRATFGGQTGEKQIVLILPVPADVTGLSASQGTSCDKVALFWTSAANAAKYAVYRDGARIAETAATTFGDTTATPGTLYAYSVRGVNSAGESASAPTAQGYRRLAAPTQVMASNGTYSDRIRITWREVIGAAAYQVSRATSATGTKTAVSSWTTATSFDDTSSAAGVSYSYFVKAAATSSGDRPGDFSAAAVGLRKQVRTLVDLTLNGPDAVQSGASVRYTATAVYSDDSSEEVAPASWSVTGEARVAADGTLSSNAFSGGEEKVVTLSASYTYGGVTKSAEKEVRLIPIERKAEVTQLSAAQRFPFNGLVDIDFTLANTPADTRAEVTLSGRDTVSGRVLTPRTLNGDRTNLESGDHRVTWDLAADYPGYHTESFTVDLTAAPMPETPPEPDPGEHAFVQLWENGPYWATTNIGADKPEDPGYYFWWGDTVGYDKCDENGWFASDGSGTRHVFERSSTPTYNKTIAELKLMGYVDESGNLTAEHDAATKHWGVGWRMPTAEDFDALAQNCDLQWVRQDGITGCIFKGRGAFSNNNIFIRATGICDGPNVILGDGSNGRVWSSSASRNTSWYFGFSYSGANRYDTNPQHYGFAIRPVRDFAAPGPGSLVFPTITAFTASGREPIDGKIDLNLTIAADEWPTNAVTLSFSAVDNVGGTNLTVRTLAYADGQSATITAAGDYHVVWNVAADLGRVALANVTMKATLSETFGGALATAVEATAWTFTNDSSAPWSVDTMEQAEGASSVKSGVISDNGVTTLSTTVTGAGTLGFRWKIDSESGYDYLHLYVDGSEVLNNKSVNQTWETKSYAISGSGTHTIEWRYTKDGSVSNGSDCGWVDGITWNGAHPLATDEGRHVERETSAIIDTCLPLPDPGEHDYVQLWENGPYWATTNIGAEKPEDYGYYFWWGDTVGYTRDGGTWTNGYYYSDVTWVSSTGQRMSASPFSLSTVLTYNKTVAELKSLGYVDASGNLTAEHDAATQHWGAGWRMPTDAEFAALLNNCDSQWTTLNGVAGRVFKGRGAFAGRSIFVPAAGYGYGSYLSSPGSYGDFWSSTPYSDNSVSAWSLFFNSGDVSRRNSYRNNGFTVRPVREFAQ